MALLAATVYLGAAWGAELVMLPSSRWCPAEGMGAKELAIDALHHTVYAATTSLAFAFFISGRSDD